MKETDSKTKLKDMEFTHILMGQNILDSGKRINRMDGELKLDLMVLSILEIIKRGKSMGEGYSHGLMGVNMKASLRIITLMAMDRISGVTDDRILGDGKITKWTGKEFLHGKMAGRTEDSMLMTKKKAEEFFNDLTESDMKGSE